MEGKRVRLVLAAATAILLSACSGGVNGVPEPRMSYNSQVAAGRTLIAGYGCGSCHTIPGVPGAHSLAAPPLDRFWERSYIAGHLPNTADNLAKWIADPQGVEPGTAMPNLGVSADQARDDGRVPLPSADLARLAGTLVMKRLYPSGLLILTLLLAAGCAAAPITPPGTPSALDPKGPAAAHIASLWWLMFGLGAVIWLLVVALMFAALARRRRGSSETPPDSKGGDVGRKWVIRGGLILPIVVLAIVFGYSTYTLAAVQRQNGASVHIQVIARRWWWEVKYPDQGVITANEIHMPVGTDVQVELQSEDVIHSFWVPELHGKMDLIPTRINHITLQADQKGVYRGECAEYCGLQHAHMDFMVVAESTGDFNKWLTAQQQSSGAPPDSAAAQGQQVFANAGCVFCHTVRGLEDKSIDRSGVDLGPDLTHLASRLTIAGATLTQNEGNRRAGSSIRSTRSRAL